MIDLAGSSYNCQSVRSWACPASSYLGRRFKVFPIIVLPSECDRGCFASRDRPASKQRDNADFLSETFSDCNIRGVVTRFLTVLDEALLELTGEFVVIRMCVILRKTDIIPHEVDLLQDRWLTEKIASAEPLTLLRIKHTGENGNAFFILDRVRALLRRDGYSLAFIDQFAAEATSGDYNNLLATLARYMEVE